MQFRNIYFVFKDIQKNRLILFNGMKKGSCKKLNIFAEIYISLFLGKACFG